MCYFYCLIINILLIYLHCLHRQAALKTSQDFYKHCAYHNSGKRRNWNTAVIITLSSVRDYVGALMLDLRETTRMSKYLGTNWISKFLQSSFLHMDILLFGGVLTMSVKRMDNMVHFSWLNSLKNDLPPVLLIRLH